MMSSSAAFLYLFALALLVMITQISARPVCYSGKLFFFSLQLSLYGDSLYFLFSFNFRSLLSSHLFSTSIMLHFVSLLYLFFISFLNIGSSMYQLVTQDCATKDKSYNGTWYCAKMEICESFMNKNRECITTRGCATSEECVDSSSATGYYNGNKVQVSLFLFQLCCQYSNGFGSFFSSLSSLSLLQVSSGVNPAGMTVTATCCKAYEFSDDDTIAINYDDICNSASSIKMSSTFVVGIATIVALAQYMLYQ